MDTGRLFDRSRLTLLPLEEREHLLDLRVVKELRPEAPLDQKLQKVARRLHQARSKRSSSVLMMGAHVLRSGVQRYLLDLMADGWLDCLAMNGAGVIHDFELALIGATTESVGKYIADGRFGLWRETGIINEVVADAAREGLGLGEAVGRYIEEEKLPHRDISVLAAGYRLGVPVTVHVGIGYDIVHEHPNCDGAAYGQTSYQDFLTFAQILTRLTGGVAMCFGSAVMAPEVFLKALSMARNLARQEGGVVGPFTTLVCDLLPLPDDYRQEAPRDSAGYYFRPWKTLLVRTVAEGGESFYIQGRHEHLIPRLWTALKDEGGDTI